MPTSIVGTIVRTQRPKVIKMVKIKIYHGIILKSSYEKFGKIKIANIYKTDKAKYEATAKEWTRKYAT